MGLLSPSTGMNKRWPRHRRKCKLMTSLIRRTSRWPLRDPTPSLPFSFHPTSSCRPIGSVRGIRQQDLAVLISTKTRTRRWWFYFFLIKFHRKGLFSQWEINHILMWLIYVKSEISLTTKQVKWKKQERKCATCNWSPKTEYTEIMKKMQKKVVEWLWLLCPPPLPSLPSTLQLSDSLLFFRTKSNKAINRATPAEGVDVGSPSCCWNCHKPPAKSKIRIYSYLTLSSSPKSPW